MFTLTLLFALALLVVAFSRPRLRPWRIVAVALALTLTASVAVAGPVRNLLHRVTHPLEGVREHRSNVKTPAAVPQRMPQTSAAPASTAKLAMPPCVGGNCPLPKK